jgi:hypothetical protein
MALQLGSKAVAALKLGAADVGLHLGPTPITGVGVPQGFSRVVFNGARVTFNSQRVIAPTGA